MFVQLRGVLHPTIFAGPPAPITPGQGTPARSFASDPQRCVQPWSGSGRRGRISKLLIVLGYLQYRALEQQGREAEARQADELRVDAERTLADPDKGLATALWAI